MPIRVLSHPNAAALAIANGITLADATVIRDPTPFVVSTFWSGVISIVGYAIVFGCTTVLPKVWPIVKSTWVEWTSERERIRATSMGGQLASMDRQVAEMRRQLTAMAELNRVKDDTILALREQMATVVGDVAKARAGIDRLEDDANANNFGQTVKAIEAKVCRNNEILEAGQDQSDV